MLELIFSMAIWGSIGLFVMWSKLPALEIAFYRCLIGSVFVGVYLLYNHKSITFNRYSLKVAVAGVFLVLNWIFLFKSFQVSSITIGNMSYYLQPVILLILGFIFFKEKPSLYKIALILMAFTGVIMIMITKNIPTNNIVIGALLALLAAVFYSVLTIIMKTNKLGFFEVIFIQLVIGTIILIPFVPFSRLTTSSILYLLLIGVVHTVLAYYLYYKAIKKIDLASIAIISYLDPIVAIGTDVIFFNRTLNNIQILGILITFISIYMVVRPKKLI